MNKVILTGRLTKDLELRKIERGDNSFSVANFSLAVNHGYGDNKKTFFFDCTAFRQSAEFLAKYAGKGDEILVDGVLTVESWEKNGEKKSKTVVVVNHAEISRRKGGGQEQSGSDKVINAFSGKSIDEEIPF